MVPLFTLHCLHFLFIAVHAQLTLLIGCCYVWNLVANYAAGTASSASLPFLLLCPRPPLVLALLLSYFLFTRFSVCFHSLVYCFMHFFCVSIERV
ncbi:hypothetical protein R3P38DRAFT_2988038 [Favolaschia claudopus]|uniref:Secreted peptide n=1 Tax=Favolaschia claudopus TaxID=2862362 RepID=A0AAW0AU03_9AGAR